MTRVLQVTTVPVTMTLFVLPLAQALTETGCEVELAYGGPERRAFVPFASHHIALSRAAYHPANVCGLWQLVRLMRASAYSAVHLHTPVAGAVGRLAARLAGVPMVLYTVHGSFWGTAPRWRAALYDWLERVLARWTQHVFVQNEDDGVDMVRRCGLARQQVTRLPAGGAGVALDVFDPLRFAPETVLGVRRALGLDDGDVVVGYVGRIDREKGVHELLQAIVRLKPMCSRLRLLLVGDRVPGDRKIDIDRLLIELGPAVICAGFRDDVPEMMACMDLVVLPSFREGFGSVLAEAASMGKAVVATATRGACAAVVDGETGVLVPIGDADALVRGIEALVSDEAARNRMGLAARERARKQFDRQKVLAVYQDVYQRLLGVDQ